MYLNVSKDIIIRDKDIVAIFNLDYVKNTKEYKKFLNNMLEKKEIIKESEKQEKTFILTENAGKVKGYITNIKANTIVKREKLK